MTLDPAEGSATGDLRDLGVLCGKEQPPSTGGRFRVGRAGVAFTTEDTEVTEALGSFTSHSAGLWIDTTIVLLGLRNSRARRAGAAAIVWNGSKRYSSRVRGKVFTSEPERWGRLAVRIIPAYCR